jgi:hypothetical protein
MSTSTASVLFTVTTTGPKVLYLPPASTLPGRLLYIKDICGNSAPSSIYISTSAGDLIDYKASTWYAVLSTSSGLVKLASNGSNNWMVLSHYTNAIGQPPYIPPPPPPPPFSGWSTNINGDGSATDQGGGQWYIIGANDGAGNGWSYIYGQYGSAGSLTYGFNWFTGDGITWDWPFEFVTANNPADPNNVNFNTKIASANSQTGSRTVSYAANDYVVLGVYSADSVAGAGFCTFTGLTV